jgi:hypothetical protein
MSNCFFSNRQHCRLVSVRSQELLISLHRRRKMYQVTRRESEITITGPDQFEAHINAAAVGFVIRRRPEWPDEPIHYAIQFAQMTDSEVVACVFGIESYPT